MRTLRFAEGEPAIVVKPSNIQRHNVYVGSPCHIVERGPMAHPYNFHDMYDYIVAMCDGRQMYINDDCLKKIEPPADDVAETEQAENDLEVVA